MNYPVDTLFGRSFLRRQASKANNAVRSTVVGRVAARSVETGARMGVNAAKDVGHAAATAGRAIGHAAAEGSRVAMRVAKRLIRSVARPIMNKMLRGDMDFILSGEDPKSISGAMKAAIITAITAPATAAVAAGTVTAPAAPAVPTIVPVVVSELLDQIGTMGKKVLEGKDPFSDPEADQAIAAQDSGLSQNDALQAANLKRPNFKLYAIGGSAAILSLFLILALRRRKKNVVYR